MATGLAQVARYVEKANRMVARRVIEWDDEDSPRIRDMTPQTTEDLHNINFGHYFLNHFAKAHRFRKETLTEDQRCLTRTYVRGEIEKLQQLTSTCESIYKNAISQEKQNLLASAAARFKLTDITLTGKIQDQQLINAKNNLTSREQAINNKIARLQRNLDFIRAVQNNTSLQDEIAVPPGLFEREIATLSINGKAFVFRNLHAAIALAMTAVSFAASRYFLS